MAGFNLAQAIHGQVDAASVVALELTQTGEATERTLEEIAADIVRKDQQVGLGLISIGNDLIEAKAKVEHGKWREWLDLNVGYSERKAQMCMQIARRYGSNPQLVADLGIRKVTALMLLPAGEDAEFLETHDVPNMSTRELEDAIRERDEAKAAAEYSEKKLDELSRAFDESQTALEDEKARTLELNTKIKELEARPIDVAVQVDEEAVKKAADEARAAAEAEWSARVRVAEDKLAKAEEKAKKAAEKAQTAGEDATKKNAAELEAAKKAEADAKAEAEQLRAELERAKRAAANAVVASDADFTQCLTLAEQIKSFANTINGVKLKAVNQGDEIKAEKLKKLILRIADDVRGCA